MVYQSEYMGRLALIKEAILRLGISDFNDNGASFDFNPYDSTPKVTLYTYNQNTFDLFKTGIEHGMGASVEWETEFDDRTAQFQYRAKTFGVEITLQLGAKQCQVEVIEEDVDIPARTEKRKKYVLKSKDCEEPAPAAEPDLLTKVAIAAGALPTAG